VKLSVRKFLPGEFALPSVCHLASGANASPHTNSALSRPPRRRELPFGLGDGSLEVFRVAAIAATIAVVAFRRRISAWLFQRAPIVSDEALCRSDGVLLRS
jgi:hypothetical protein